MISIFWAPYHGQSSYFSLAQLCDANTQYNFAFSLWSSNVVFRRLSASIQEVPQWIDRDAINFTASVGSIEYMNSFNNNNKKCFTFILGRAECSVHEKPVKIINSIGKFFHFPFMLWLLINSIRTISFFSLGRGRIVTPVLHYAYWGLCLKKQQPDFGTSKLCSTT